jgi:hypothetical protein
LLPSQIVASNWNQAALTSSVIQSTAQTQAGQNYLAKLIGCSLSSSQSITVTVGGLPMTFYGSVGLATSWTGRGLSSTQSHWVSSCVLTLSNYFGDVVTISIRGSATQLALQGTEGTDFNGVEGAYWGTIFGSTVQAYSCIGADEQHYPNYGDFQYRVCAEPDGQDDGFTNCGFHDMGACASACTTSTSPFSGCSDGTNSWNEVITSWISGTPS